VRHIYPITRLSLWLRRLAKLLISAEANNVKDVGEVRFALTKTPKSHFKHELKAHLSTSELPQFSSGIHQKVVFLLVHHKLLEAALRYNSGSSAMLL
jgi:hypothetical protein